MPEDVAFRRTEAKAFFANERTFLHWMGMSVTLGTIASALAGVSGHLHRHWGEGYNVKTVAVRILAMVMLGVAIIIAIGACYNFHFRWALLKNRADGPYGNQSLPSLLSLSLMVVFVLVFVGALISYEGWK